MRILAITAAATATAMALTGCGADPQPKAKDAPTLTVWADDSRAAPLQDIAAGFARDRGVKVKVVQKAMGNLRDDFVSQAPSGQGPDVIVGPHDWLGKLVQNGVVAPIDLSTRAARFSKVAVKAMAYRGRTYGLPYAIESVAVLRNTKQVHTAPKTFDELVAKGEELGAKYPVGLPVDPKAGSPFHLYPLQTSFGSQVLRDGKPAIDDAHGLKFAAYLRGLAEKKAVSTSLTGDIATNAFINGQTPFLVTGPWDAPALTKAGVPFAVDPVPPAGDEPARPFTAVQGFYVSSKSANPLLAQDFVLNHLGTPKVQKALYKAGGRPPAMNAVRKELAGDQVTARFADVAAKGVPTPNIPQMEAVWSDWGLSQLGIITGQGDPAELTRKAADRIRAKIGS
ncbi:maltose ABC transporter substrate-binding protein [Streptomyces sp. NPDC006510]|uniref:sugar ABC transporter substrate-binding protein n=1 Tax=Streptomyces sp. NPDC006510 TaxID=3155600 RepID=UPI0033A8874A